MTLTGKMWLSLLGRLLVSLAYTCNMHSWQLIELECSVKPSDLSVDLATALRSPQDMSSDTLPNSFC